MPVLKVRAANVGELAEGAGFLFLSRPFAINRPMRSRCSPVRLPRCSPGCTRRLTQCTTGIRRRSKARYGRWPRMQGVKLGQVAQPVRVALTGRRTSPGIFDVLVLLGREESLAQIADQIA
ncbi:hypothetical protein AB5I41_17750 [Sphingomonas sp. MMS24-JH45]